MDYAGRIDAETRAFIRRTRDFAGDGTLAGERTAYDAMARAFHHGHPPGVTAHDAVLDEVTVRRYRPPGGGLAGAGVLYLHGGGFMLGGLDSHDDICAEIAATAGLAVAAADYRLTPEHPHPAAVEDCVAVARALLAEGAVRLVLAGDSAGGNLAAAVARALRCEPRLSGLVLIYPGLGGDIDSGSYLTHADAPLLTRADVLAYEALRFGDGKAPRDDASAAPLRDNDYSGLPPVIAFAAECDPLADDARNYAERVAAAGGYARWQVEPGLVHGYLRARHCSARAGASFARITAAIAALGRGERPE
jgi:acetyl esterase